MNEPFPPIHLRANEEAAVKAEGARARTEAASVFLEELDELLAD